MDFSSTVSTSGFQGDLAPVVAEELKQVGTMPGFTKLGIPLNNQWWFPYNGTSQSKMDDNWGFSHFMNVNSRILKWRYLPKIKAYVRAM